MPVTVPWAKNRIFFNSLCNSVDRKFIEVFWGEQSIAEGFRVIEPRWVPLGAIPSGAVGPNRIFFTSGVIL